MIGVVVPAHNEAASIERCLDSICLAATHSALRDEPVVVFVAADACTDATAALATAAGATVVTVDVRNVGAARFAATSAAISAGARWIASTDADSYVSPPWLAEQLALHDAGVHAVCGVVEVADWLDHSLQVRRSYEAAYFAVEGHPHVHGACLGFSREAYVAAGGWPSLGVHEDVALISAIEGAGYRVSRSAAVLVTTSARRNPRARGGFGDHLSSLATPSGARAAVG